jgi:hypothetical protein
MIGILAVTVAIEAVLYVCLPARRRLVMDKVRS